MTDLDIVSYDEISELKVVEEGNTTTSANILFDILRKFHKALKQTLI